jgi:short-subunit dehydrogenase
MKNILIIGATSTIAQECAKSWSNRGYKILLIGRNQKKLKKIYASIVFYYNIFLPLQHKYYISKRYIFYNQ